MNWWLIGGAAALVLIARQAKAASAQCKPCYDAKSTAYRACTAIPPEQRTQREACFRVADQAFNNCLRACGG
jgi:hypothetical protein